MNQAKAIAGLAAGGSTWPQAAASLLADLGFSLINSDRPGAPGGSNLLVAFRDLPTLRHFDPERMTFWVVRDGRGRLIDIDPREDQDPADTGPIESVPVSWGSIRVYDRILVENRFLSFGGALRVARLDASLTVTALASPGPIVRWGGHSQGADPLAGEIGAFFGRLMVPVDFEPGAEGRLAATPPVTLYAAFLRHLDARLRASARFRTSEHALQGWLTRETTRIAREAPDAWADGWHLLQDLAVAPVPA